MTAANLKHRLLRLLHIENPGSSPDYIAQDVTEAVNAAYQVLWTTVPRNERSHYTRTISSITLVPGTWQYDLATTQGVFTPVYLDLGYKILAPANSKNEVLNYYRNQGLSESVTGRPDIYYCERIAQNADSATKTTLLLAPTPAAAESLHVEVEKIAPRFTTAEFCADSPPSLQIPHDYAESILLPVALHFAARSHWFNRPELLPVLKQDAEAALIRAGATDTNVLSAEKGETPSDT